MSDLSTLTAVGNKVDTKIQNCVWDVRRFILLTNLVTDLKELEADKLIVRTEYPQIPPKVEYTLSERGKTLMTVLDQLCVWGEENRLTE